MLHLLPKVSENERKVIHSCLLNTTAYNIPLFIKFHQGLNISKIYNLLTRYFEQYAIFRTFYQVDADITKCTNLAIPTIEIQSFKHLDKNLLCDMNLISIKDKELVRVVLCKVADEDCDYMFINIHHVLLDGFSINLFLQDLIEVYLYDREIDLQLSTLVDERDSRKAEQRNESLISFEEYEYFKSRLLQKQVDSVNYIDDQLEITGNNSQKYTDFAICVTAFSMSMAQWLESRAIYMTYPHLGRDSRNYKMLGNFVQLIPFHHHFTSEEDDRIDNMIAAIQQSVFSSFTNQDGYDEVMRKERMSCMNIFRDVIFDFKSGSLIEKAINEDHEIVLEEATMYRDEKYGLHFSIYKVLNRLTINIISSEYGMDDLQDLLASFRHNVQSLYAQEHVYIRELLTINEVEEKETIETVTSSKQGLVYDQVTSMVSFLIEEERAVGSNESFFDLGMDSLLLVKFKKKVKEAFNINLKISDFFNFYTSELLTRKIMDNLKEAK